MTEEPLRRRLYDAEAYTPWVRAEQGLDSTFLFWMPVSGFPMTHTEKTWLAAFLDKFHARLEADHGLRQELFLQFKGVDEFGDAFRKYTMQCLIRMGIGRAGQEPFSGMPSPEEIQKVVENRTAFDYKDWMANYLVWFVTKEPAMQRELFAGFGQMMTLFLPPDPGIKPPKFNITPSMRAALSPFKTWDVDGMIAGTIAMGDAFQAKSKTMFGQGLEETPEYPGLAFVLPLLNSAQFFLADDEKRAQWFSMFDVYVNESKADKGVLLAFAKPELEDVLLDTLEELRRDGPAFPRFAA